MRLKLFFILIGIGGMIFSAHKVYVALTNRQPTRMSCGEFVRSGSGAKWVELTGCELDLENAVGLQSRILKVDKGLYIPVRPVGETGTPAILLKTNDNDASAGIREEPATGSALAGDASDSPAVVTVSGMVESAFDGNRKSRRALDKVAREGVVRRDYIVVAAGESPTTGDLVTGIFLLVIIPVIAWAVWRGNRRSARAAAAGIGPAGAPPPSPAWPQPPTPPFPPAGSPPTRPPPPMPPLPPAPG